MENNVEKVVETNPEKPVEKSEKKKINKDTVKIFILFAIFVCALIAVIIYIVNFVKQQNFYVPEKNTEETKKEINQNELTEKLYSQIYKGTIDSKGLDESIYIYQDKKVKLEELSSLYLYMAITSNMNIDEVKEIMVPELDEESIVENEDGSISTVTKTKIEYQISVDKFNEATKKLYGTYVFTPKVRLTTNEFNEVNGLGLLCQSADNDNIYCNKKETQYNQDRIYGYITKVEESDNYIYVYEKVVYVDIIEDDRADIYSGKKMILNNYAIDDLISRVDNGEMTEEEFINQIGNDKVSKYMHTFKKDNNTGYWVSVEPTN